jgi:hypothetical protein
MKVLILEWKIKTAYHPIFHAYEQTDLFSEKEILKYKEEQKSEIFDQSSLKIF